MLRWIVLPSFFASIGLAALSGPPVDYTGAADLPAYEMLPPSSAYAGSDAAMRPAPVHVSAVTPVPVTLHGEAMEITPVALPTADVPVANSVYARSSAGQKYTSMLTVDPALAYRTPLHDAWERASEYLPEAIGSAILLVAGIWLWVRQSQMKAK